MNLVFHTRVKLVEERSRVVRSWKDDKGDVQHDQETMGWFVVFEGIPLSFSVGLIDPELKAGDNIRLRAEKVVE